MKCRTLEEQKVIEEYNKLNITSQHVPKQKRAKPKLVRIKEAIGEPEYKKLMSFTRGDEDIKEVSKERFLLTFTLLYHTGLRLNELMQFKYKDIQNFLDEGEGKAIASKQGIERRIFISEDGIKQINKIFKCTDINANHYIISKRNAPTINLHPITFIKAVNTQLKKVLGSGYTSHSFRRGLITEMARKGVNQAFIRDFIGHKNSSTTAEYIKATKTDLKNSMVR